MDSSNRYLRIALIAAVPIAIGVFTFVTISKEPQMEFKALAIASWALLTLFAVYRIVQLWRKTN